MFFCINSDKKGMKYHMAYFSSPSQYEKRTGRKFTTNCSCIHRTGSVRGMVKQGFWKKNADRVRYGNYIYSQP